MSRARAAVAVLLMVPAACGTGSGGAAGGKQHQTLTVFAASSLTGAFTAVGEAYESAHTGTYVRFSFAASSDLVQHIQQGAPADVIATASTKTMDQVAKELAAPAKPFARNKLVIVTAPGNPEHISSLADLAKHGLLVVLAAVG